LEGIYFFGGIDRNGKYATNSELTILRINEKPCKWDTIHINGQCPAPRKLSTINYNEVLQILIVYGGKNDESNVDITFNDFFIMDLINLIWYKVKIFDGIPKERYEHSSVVFDDKLIVFGGMDSKMYIPSDLYQVTLGI